MEREPKREERPPSSSAASYPASGSTTAGIKLSSDSSVKKKKNSNVVSRLPAAGPRGANLLCNPRLRDPLSIALRYMRNPSNFRQCCRFTIECWDHAVYLEGFLPCLNRNLDSTTSKLSTFASCRELLSQRLRNKFPSWKSAPELPREQRRRVQVDTDSVAAPSGDSAPSGPFLSLNNTPSKTSDFEILETLGTGSLSQVRLCRLKLQGHKEKGTYFAMKTLSKEDVLKHKQVDHMRAERDIMTKLDHPFIAGMPWNFQDEQRLYMVMEFVNGGELFAHLRIAERLPNDVAKFYLAEIILAIEYMHQKNIIHRDIKPENLLLDSKGHAKILGFGYAKELDRSGRTFTLCGTPEYFAPEVVECRGHGKPVDWWTVGILLFEFLCGYSPFFDESPFKIYGKILEGKIKFPSWVDPHARDLVKGFLLKDPEKRLGTLKNVKHHPYFRGANWQRLFDRQYPAPILVKVTGPGDTGNFVSYPEETADNFKPLTPEQHAEFKNF